MDNSLVMAYRPDQALLNVILSTPAFFRYLDADLFITSLHQAHQTWLMIHQSLTLRHLSSSARQQDAIIRMQILKFVSIYILRSSINLTKFCTCLLGGNRPCIGYSVWSPSVCSQQRKHDLHKI